MRTVKIIKTGDGFTLYYNDRTIKLPPNDTIRKLWEEMDKIDLLEDQV